jgi:hypothetical protein
MNKATKIAIMVTITLWLAGSIGCNAIEGLTGGIHQDIKNYNQGNADARKEQRR